MQRSAPSTNTAIRRLTIWSSTSPPSTAGIGVGFFVAGNLGTVCQGKYEILVSNSETLARVGLTYLDCANLQCLQYAPRFVAVLCVFEEFRDVGAALVQEKVIPTPRR